MVLGIRESVSRIDQEGGGVQGTVEERAQEGAARRSKQNKDGHAGGGA
jgi:hypothetical protein